MAKKVRSKRVYKARTKKFKRARKSARLFWGKAKTEYMREYMRHRRAGQKTKPITKHARTQAADTAPEIAKTKPAAELIEARKEIERLHKRIDEWLQFDAAYDVWLHEADKIVKSRKGVMTRAQWTHLVHCLHSNHRGQVTDEEFDRAARLVINLKLALLNEQQEPTRSPKKPRLDWEDMMRRRAAKKKTNRLAR
jgi:hypothetical protein